MEDVLVTEPTNLVHQVKILHDLYGSCLYLFLFLVCVNLNLGNICILPQDSMASIDYTEVDNGFCSWIMSVFTLSDDKFMRKCGVDAVQYLKFQRHMIVFVAIMTVICLSVILPINIQVPSILYYITILKSARVRAKSRLL